MNKKRFAPVAILALVLLLTVAAFSTAFAGDTTDAIAGTWYGNMHFSDANFVQRVAMTIPAGCQAGQVCGSLQNFPVQCTWELTYDGYDGTSYLYHFSNTLDGVCPAGSSGSLALLGDGSLLRKHSTPQFDAWGVLKQRPNAD